jgi:hypothetical protein
VQAARALRARLAGRLRAGVPHAPPLAATVPLVTFARLPKEEQLVTATGPHLQSQGHVDEHLPRRRSGSRCNALLHSSHLNGLLAEGCRKPKGTFAA